MLPLRFQWSLTWREALGRQLGVQAHISGIWAENTNVRISWLVELMENEISWGEHLSTGLIGWLRGKCYVRDGYRTWSGRMWRESSNGKASCRMMLQKSKSESLSHSWDAYHLNTKGNESIELAHETVSLRKHGQSMTGEQVSLQGCRQWLW